MIYKIEYLKAFNRIRINGKSYDCDYDLFIDRELNVRAIETINTVIPGIILPEYLDSINLDVGNMTYVFNSYSVNFGVGENPFHEVEFNK